MDQITGLNLSDDLIKLRLENISRDARKKREKNRTLKQLYSDKEVNEYKLKLIKAQQEAKGANKYFLPEQDIVSMTLDTYTPKNTPLSDTEIKNKEAQISKLAKDFDDFETELYKLSSVERQTKYRTDADYNNMYERVILKPLELINRQLNQIIKNTAWGFESLNTYIDKQIAVFSKKTPSTPKDNATPLLNKINLFFENTNNILNQYSGYYNDNNTRLLDNLLTDKLPVLPVKIDIILEDSNTKDDVNNNIKTRLNEFKTKLNAISDIGDIQTAIGKTTAIYDRLKNVKIDKDLFFTTFSDETVLKDITNRQKLISDNIRALTKELDTNKEKILENQAEESRVKKENRSKLESYRNQFNLLNQYEGDFGAQQPDETEEEYLARIQSSVGQANDNDEYQVLAELDTLRTLKDNLKQLITDETNIMEVIKDLDENTRFEINKIFPSIKDKFLKRFGFNNTSLSTNDISEYLTDKVNEPESAQTQSEPQTQNLAQDTLAKNGLEVLDKQIYNVVYEDDFRPSTTGVKTNFGKLKIQRVVETNKFIYLKLGPQTGGGSKVYYSTDNTGYQGTYNLINWGSGKGIHNYKNVFDIIDLDVKDQNNTKYGFSDYKNCRMVLIAYGLISKDAQEFRSKQSFKNIFPSDPPAIFDTTTGMGIANKYNIPKEPVKYGKIYINLDKLYYKNILSIKDEKGGQIQSMKNTPVSDDFVNYVLKGFVNEPVSELDYKKIRSSELELLDQLNYLAGFAKEKNINKTNHIDKLKNELELITGSITAGNNNKKLLDDLRNVLMKLTSFDAISMTNAQKYYNQFKDQF